VPVLFGEAEPAEVARVLTPHLDDHTVVVASSDLSHDHSYNEARSLDNWCIEAVRGMDLDLMKRQEACGKGPILTLMQLAKERGWKPHVLDYRTSGDLPKAPRDKVVGYMAAVFTEGEDEPPKALVANERTFLLKVARQTLSDTVNKKPLPRVDRSTLTLGLLQPRGVFVTLNKDGELRGCIGHTLPRQALYRAVIENTISAATRDQRFPAVRAEELEKIRIDISVLTLPKKIYYNQPSDLLKRLRPHVDGVLLQVPVIAGGQQRVATSVYLPAVWDRIPEPGKFMDQLSLKAGLAANAWRQPTARVFTFQAEEFREIKE
jgi:AmmeMemoRadiSam system protein A